MFIWNNSGTEQSVRMRSGAVHRLPAWATWMVAVGLAAPLVVLPLKARPGSADPNFGDQGAVLTSFDGYDTASARGIVVQPDGKIVVVGLVANLEGEDFALARYNQDGVLDPTFGNGGKVTLDIASHDRPKAVALQADGKIIVAGYTRLYQSAGFSDFVLAQFHGDGSLDASFGNGGIVATDIGTSDELYGLAVDVEGRVIVAGQVDFDIVVARYTPTGNLDPEFGQGGISRMNMGNFEGARAVAIQPDGKIIVAGNHHDGSRDYLVLIRHDQDGNLDPSFGTDGGVLKVRRAWDFYAHDLIIQPDSRIIVVGTASPLSGDYNWNTLLLRYHPDGSLDRSFGKNGIVNTSFHEGGDEAVKVMLQYSGKIVLLVSKLPGEDYVATQSVYRLMSDGSRDDDFGRYAAAELPGDGSQTRVSDLAIHPDGSVVAVGSFYDQLYLGKIDAMSLPPWERFSWEYSLLLIDETDPTNLATNGLLSLRIRRDGSFSAVLTTAMGRFRARSGYGFDSADSIGFWFEGKGLPNNYIEFDLILDRENGSLSLDARTFDGGWRDIWSLVTPGILASAQRGEAGLAAGKYNSLFEPSNPDRYGTGFLSSKLTPRGKIRAVGRSPSGARLRGTAGLDDSGVGSFFFRTDKGSGFLTGQQAISPEGMVQGSFEWVLGMGSRDLGYPDGIHEAVTVTGERYIAPDPRELILAGEQGASNHVMLTATGADIPTSQEALFELSAGHAFHPAPGSEGSKLKIRPASGAAYAVIEHPPGNRTRLQGVLLRNSNTIRGVFRVRDRGVPAGGFEAVLSNSE